MMLYGYPVIGGLTLKCDLPTIKSIAKEKAIGLSGNLICTIPLLRLRKIDMLYFKNHVTLPSFFMALTTMMIVTSDKV